MARELHRAEFASFTVRAVGYAAGERMPRHAHDYSNVTAIISGEMMETIDDGEHRGATCSVLLKPAGTEHTNHAIGRKGTLCVTVQLAATLSQWAWFEDGPSANTALELYRALRSGADVESAAFALLGGVSAAAELRCQRKPAWLVELLKTLDRDFEEPIRFEQLAHAAGMHPVYISRAFHRHTGMTMQQYVRTKRLARARHLLSTTSRAIHSIAAETGFADPAHLCRSMKGDIDLTPKQYRGLFGSIPA
jgi:AraC family transcriptional regulator